MGQFLITEMQYCCKGFDRSILRICHEFDIVLINFIIEHKYYNIEAHVLCTLS